ncbi:hypothetical protein [Brachybacterium massiliense]|uniref:hypothetical protein n=1 Tax=Brachybacterium massiliense TaxID=1755098 RepID=UPI001483C49B|nr:hypothetical protein [Brachybacterium massiliense]
MTSTIVPPVDLAPGMPSRVVTISATDVTEGGQSMAGGVLLTTDTTITMQEAPNVA